LRQNFSHTKFNKKCRAEGRGSRLAKRPSNRKPLPRSLSEMHAPCRCVYAWPLSVYRFTSKRTNTGGVETDFLCTARGQSPSELAKALCSFTTKLRLYVLRVRRTAKYVFPLCYRGFHILMPVSIFFCQIFVLPTQNPASS